MRCLWGWGLNPVLGMWLCPVNVNPTLISVKPMVWDPAWSLLFQFHVCHPLNQYLRWSLGRRTHATNQPQQEPQNSGLSLSLFCRLAKFQGHQFLEGGRQTGPSSAACSSWLWLPAGKDAGHRKTKGSLAPLGLAEMRGLVGKLGDLD